MKKRTKLLVSFLVLFLVQFYFFNYAQAATYVSGNISAGTVWSKENSPYIFNGDVYVGEGQSLHIEAGTEISTDTFGYNLFLGKNSTLDIKGTKSDRVNIEKIYRIWSEQAHVYIDNADFKIPGPLLLLRSKAKINNSSFGDSSGNFLISYGSQIEIDSSTFDGSSSGIWINGTADAGSPPVSIRNSILKNNYSNSIINESTTTVSAENNWWGSPNGPGDNGQNSIIGAVRYDPWLKAEPAFSVDCCSSVLFIPGLTGTELRADGLLGQNVLWPPNTNHDIAKLALDHNGSSTRQDIISGEPLAKVFGLVDVYGGFMKFLDGQVEQGKIKEWKSFGYDWRKSVAEVVAGPELKDHEKKFLIKEVENLAENSKTGKVTIIAHSNGGLVTKELVKNLVLLGKENLIEKVISVAVPYLGTPGSIAGLLHGEGYSIGPYGILATPFNMRNLGSNMLSAYSLLPSVEYFKKVLSPTIAFASTTVSGLNNGSYPKQIRDYSSQSSFIADSEDMRVDAGTNTNVPIKGNDLLLGAANIIHATLDPFVWPTNIIRYAIVGWNNKTIQQVFYSAYNKHISRKTNMGDDTVVVPSAVYEAGKVAKIDLQAISEIEGKKIKHMNILESKTVQDLAGQMIDNADESNVPNGVTWGEPDYSDEQPMLVLSTHSPVELHVYDEKGRHTGIVSKPNISSYDEEGSIEDGLYTFYEEEIPGSSFEVHGNDANNRETYVYLPDDGKTYEVKIKGLAIGTFDYVVSKEKGNLLGEPTILSSVSYLSIPVTNKTIATTSTAVSELNVDWDGNGVADIKVKPNEQNSRAYRQMLIEALKKFVLNLRNDRSQLSALIQQLVGFNR